MSKGVNPGLCGNAALKGNSSKRCGLCRKPLQAVLYLIRSSTHGFHLFLHLFILILVMEVMVGSQGISARVDGAVDAVVGILELSEKLSFKKLINILSER